MTLFRVLFLMTSVLHFSAHASNIEENKDGYYGSGWFVGTVGQAALQGWIFKTYEVSVALGAFAKDAKFPGEERKLSIMTQDIFEKISKLDPNRTYAFKFVRRHPINIFHVTKPTLIQDAIEIDPAQEAALAGGMKSSDMKQGGFATGSLTGRFLNIERWGLLGHYVCTVTLGLGGMETIQKTVARPVTSYDSSGNASHGTTYDTVSETVMKRRKLNVYDEKVCQYAEAVLKAGSAVRVTFTEDHIEWWDKNRKIVHEIVPVPNL